MADPARRRAAERKEFGNRVYEKGKLGAALDAYTEAIALDPTWAVPLVNRAIVHRMRAEWRDVQADCEKALGLDRDNMKARYLLGLALMEMDGDAQVAPATSDDSAPSTRACRELQIAYELAREKGAQLKDDVWRALARAKYRAYANAAKHRTARRRELQARIVAMLDASDGAGGADAAELVSVFADAAKATGDGTADEAPEWATCVLTYDIMRDPVVTPSGLSYERSALVDHLERNGWDPVTREPCNVKSLHENVALRAAVADYLESHPSLYGEVANEPESMA